MALERHDPMLTDVGAVDLMRPVRRPTIAELRVLQLVALGLSSREIASRLWVSRQAVTYHIGNLFMKLHADSRAGLVARAYALGIFSPGIWPPAIDATYAHPSELTAMGARGNRGRQPPVRSAGSGRAAPIELHASCGSIEAG
jgi:DNA-binding CsgD family transcriptional regulator